MVSEENKWNDRYNQKDFVYGKEPNDYLKIAMLKISNQANNFLCIAEGEGRNAVYLAKEGKNVTAWDFAEEGLAKLDTLAKINQVTVQTELVDLTKVKWEENKWDSIVNVYGHFHEDNRNDIFEGIIKSVKPGGYFISEVYSKEQLAYETGGPKKLELLYQPEELLSIFKDWKTIDFYTGEVYRKEGQMHQGNCHMIQMIFQKEISE